MSDIQDKARRDNPPASIAAIRLAKQTRTSRIHKCRSPERAPRASSSMGLLLVERERAVSDDPLERARRVARASEIQERRAQRAAPRDPA